MIKKPLRSLAVLIAAFALSVAGLQSASASADGPETCYGGACVWFTSYGDIIHVEDVSSNGLSAVGQVWVPDTGVAEYLWNTDGYGSIDTKKYGGTVQDIPEGDTVYYRACKGTTPVDCNPAGWAHGTA